MMNIIENFEATYYNEEQVPDELLYEFEVKEQTEQVRHHPVGNLDDTKLFALKVSLVVAVSNPDQMPSEEHLNWVLTSKLRGSVLHHNSEMRVTEAYLAGGYE